MRWQSSLTGCRSLTAALQPRGVPKPRSAGRPKSWRLSRMTDFGGSGSESNRAAMPGRHPPLVLKTKTATGPQTLPSFFMIPVTPLGQRLARCLAPCGAPALGDCPARVPLGARAGPGTRAPQPPPALSCGRAAGPHAGSAIPPARTPAHRAARRNVAAFSRWLCPRCKRRDPAKGPAPRPTPTAAAYIGSLRGSSHSARRRND